MLAELVSLDGLLVITCIWLISLKMGYFGKVPTDWRFAPSTSAMLIGDSKRQPTFLWFDMDGEIYNHRGKWILPLSWSVHGGAYWMDGLDHLMVWNARGEQWTLCLMDCILFSQLEHGWVAWARSLIKTLCMHYVPFFFLHLIFPHFVGVLADWLNIIPCPVAVDSRHDKKKS